MPREMTLTDAIQQVLEQAGEPMHYKDIAEQIIADKLRTTMGATPASTVNGRLAHSIKHDAANSPFLRVDAGTYTLKSFTKKSIPSASARTDPRKDHAETEPHPDVVTSFGMFWRRTGIEWMNNPKVLGMQQLGADPVNFSKQIGVYLLYDGREVIYVGRATKRPLGQRLYEHTLDRLCTRWDRFSWFGLLPVADTGFLGELPPYYSTDPLIPALEAILIEALEPRQNRKRGDDLAAVEYLQQADPKLLKKQALERLAADL